VSDDQTLTVVLADPSRPAYERAAREVLEPRGYRVQLPAGFDEAALVAFAPECDVLVTRRRPVPDAFFAAAGRLRSVQHLGSRPDPSVERWAGRLGVPVEVTPTRGTLAVAEHTMALLLALTRRTVPGHEATVAGAYRERGLEPRRTSEVDHGFQWLQLGGLDLLHGKTLGLLGFGEIGQAVARMAQGFGMTVRYHRRRRLDEALERELDVTYAALDALVAGVDVLSLHLPHVDATERLLDEERLRSMRRGAYLINTSRGGLVDEVALCAVLAEGHLAGAGLDVFVEEPVPHDHPLLRLPNVCLSPHVGAAPARGLAEMMEQLVPNLARVAQRRPGA
jgi:glyoxylate reductase